MFGYTRRLCTSISLTTNMSALKRTLSSPTTLTSRISQHNTSVTIFQLSSHDDDIENSPRRSKRVKRQDNTEHQCQSDLDNLTHDVLADKPKKSRKSGVNATASGSALPSSSERRDVQDSPKKFKAIAQSLAIPHPPPSTWRETYDTIKDMRSRFVAPVDTMGCDRAQLKETDPKVISYPLRSGFWTNTFFIIVVESSICDPRLSYVVFTNQRWSHRCCGVETPHCAWRELIHSRYDRYGGRGSSRSHCESRLLETQDWVRCFLYSIPFSALFFSHLHETLILPDRYLKKAALKLRDEFNSDVPKTVDELCSLPGVGPKMAFLALQIAWNLCVVQISPTPLEKSSYYLSHLGIMELAWTFMFTGLQTCCGGIKRQRKILNRLGNAFLNLS